jgi:diadenosine tetraphosphate (Ap4A) HIT family hydrolase
MVGFHIFETEHFRADQSVECPIPGYLILSSKQARTRFSRIPVQATADLGYSICLACRCVEEIIKPERVYVARFGEELSKIHFHIFPRTQWLLKEYERAFGSAALPTRGPRIFDWARETFGGNSQPRIPGISLAEAVREMRALAQRRSRKGI